MSNNHIFYVGLGLFVFALITTTLQARSKPLFQTVNGKVLFAICLACITIMVVDTVQSTRVANQKLAPLERMFESRVNDFKHSTNGSAYDGKLDAIIFARDGIISDNGLDGILVEWRSYSNEASFQGVYVHAWLAILMLGIWFSCIIGLFWIKQKSRAYVVKFKAF